MDTTTTFVADGDRYEKMTYRRSGRSGVELPMVSLGLWQNFGGDRPIEVQRAIMRRAFDLGVTHFDLANNYGPPYGTAEENAGRLLAQDFATYRDELIISTKAGWDMWPGPYGDHGSRKYLLASLDQSLSRLGLDYVDIFYSHRPDPATPLEETMGALHTAVQQGKALYVGISSYGPERTRQAAAILRELGTPLLIHQPSYSMLNRWVENGLLDVLDEVGAGAIAFTALAQGLLTPKYLDGIPPDSRAAADSSTMSSAVLTRHRRGLHELNQLAATRGQSLAQLALSWVLRDARITSVVVGASSVQQLEDNVAAIDQLEFSGDELAAIDAVATDDPDIDLWREQSQIGPDTKAPHQPN
jgi:L-glyceraldehyde 3-phosphate reductase